MVEEEEEGGVMAVEDAEAFLSFVMEEEVGLQDTPIGIGVVEEGEEGNKTVVAVVEEEGLMVDGEDVLSFIMV